MNEVEIEYTNDMLLEIVKAHIEDYEEDIENVGFVVIDGQTIDDKRVVSITIGSQNNGVEEDTVVKTGDKMKINLV